MVAVHRRRRTKAKASLNVGVGVVFAYHAAWCRIPAGGVAARCSWASNVTTEKSPSRAGVVRRIARSDP